MADWDEDILIQMQILANQNFWFAKVWLFFVHYWVTLQVFTEISRFWDLHLQFYGAKGLRGLLLILHIQYVG